MWSGSHVAFVASRPRLDRSRCALRGRVGQWHAEGAPISTLRRAWSRARLGRRECGGTSGRCAGVGTPSGLGRSARHAPWPSHTPARLSGLGTPRALRRASFGGLKCRISPLSSVSPDWSWCSRGRPWVAAGRRSTFRGVATFIGSRAGKSGSTVIVHAVVDDSLSSHVAARRRRRDVHPARGRRAVHRGGSRRRA